MAAIDTRAQKPITNGYVDEASHMYTVRQRNEARTVARRLLRERDLWQDTVEMRDASIRHLESDRDALAAENANLRAIIRDMSGCDTTLANEKVKLGLTK